MVVRIAVTAVFIATALVGSASSSTPPSGGSSSSRPSIYTTTPGYTNPRDAVVADVLLNRIVFSDGVQVQSSGFVYPGQVLNLTYNGPLARFRVQNGPLASVGTPGLRYIEAEDGNSASISAQDRVMFADRMEGAWANPNLNNRVQLQTQAGYGFIVGLQTQIWDSNFADDARPELFIFEDQGNSVLTIQALDDEFNNVGTPVEVRAVDIASINPTKVWVGRWNQNGSPQSGTYELKIASLDLSRLGVTHLKWFRITTQVQGGGEASADLKIVAVDTSPAPAAQTMTFD